MIRTIIGRYVNFDTGNDYIDAEIPILKYWKIVVDHFLCEFHGTTTELQYSMAIGLVS